MYTAPKLESIHFGRPVRYDPEATDEAERQRICHEMAEAITALAAALPEHKVVPYANLPKKQYPLNREK